MYDMTKFHGFHETLLNPNMQIIIVEILYNSSFSWMFQKFYMVFDWENSDI